jgi:predicted DNA-binding protein
VTRETKKLDVRLPVEMRKALDNLAEQRTAESKATVKAADILREAIAFYLASKDIPISPDVNRGGNRRTA